MIHINWLALVSVVNLFDDEHNYLFHLVIPHLTWKFSFKWAAKSQRWWGDWNYWDEYNERCNIRHYSINLFGAALSLYVILVYLGADCIFLHWCCRGIQTYILMLHIKCILYKFTWLSLSLLNISYLYVSCYIAFISSNAIANLLVF